MKKNLFLAVVLAFSVRSAARAEQLQSWGESLQARLNALPSEQAFQTYPQQYVVVAIIGVPNVPEPGALTNPKLDDVLRIVQNRKTYWKGILDGARARMGQGDDQNAKLQLQADIAEAVLADADKDLAYLDKLPVMAFDPRVQRRWDEKAALVLEMREKARAIALP